MRLSGLVFSLLLLRIQIHGFSQPSSGLEDDQLCLSAQPIARVMIEYSAAGDYIEAVYDHREYFGGRQVLEDIYNGRENVDGEEATLEVNGFELVPMKVGGITNWADLGEISSLYLPQLRDLLKEKIHDIEYIIFWHPMYRGEEMNRSDDSAPPASSVHLDADIAAFELEELVDLITDRSIAPNQEDSAKVRDALLSKRRFIIVNAWRNINEEPVMRAPLGLFLPKYIEPNQTYPWVRPDPVTSRWYTFPRMTPHEVLMFKQYDRRMDKPSDVWHCALPLLEDGGETAEPRKSLDLRAFCILKEEVPEELDRWRFQPSIEELAEEKRRETDRGHPFVDSFLSGVQKVITPFIRR